MECCPGRTEKVQRPLKDEDSDSSEADIKKTHHWKVLDQEPLMFELFAYENKQKIRGLSTDRRDQKNQFSIAPCGRRGLISCVDRCIGIFWHFLEQ